MSKVRDLIETTTASDNDLMYIVDLSEGANAGRKITLTNLKPVFTPGASAIVYNNGDSTLSATNVKDAIDEVDTKINNHSDRHSPNGGDALAISAPVNIGDSNQIGTANSYPRADHIHAHGSQTNPLHHAAATTSANGFLSSVDKTKLNTLSTGFLQYTNSVAITTSSVSFVNASIDLDFNSLPNGLFTKVGGTDFRADFNGFVRVIASCSPFTADNDRGTEFVLRKNGVDQNPTRVRNVSKNVFDRTNSVSTSAILSCAVNDVFGLAVRSIEASLVTINPQYVLFRVEVYRLS